MLQWPKGAAYAKSSIQRTTRMSATSTDFLQVVTTTDDKEDADRIARSLVEQRLAACAQVIGPISSTYHWQGAIENSQEWLCVAKTSRGCYAALERAIRQIHRYDVPEILATPVVAGSETYLDWMRSELEGNDAAP